MRCRNLLENTLADQEIDDLCERYDMADYKIVGGKVGANGDVDLSDRKLTHMPMQFGAIKGAFVVHDNELTTLENGPAKLDGHCWCNSNQLTTLHGAPEMIFGFFMCHGNKLTDLHRIP